MIDVDGDHPVVRSYFHAVLLLVPGDPTNSFDAVGHYDDELTRTADGWRISRRTMHTARLLSHGDTAAAAATSKGVPR